jgi:glycosyltransferase involved in cell wall biosynthesis
VPEARRALRRARLAAGLARRWARILVDRTPRTGPPRVYYGVDRLPHADEVAGGGILKFQRLERAFPNTRRGFNVLYLGSSSLPRDVRQLIRVAHARGVRVVWNQDGVGYPGWAGAEYRRVNAPLRRGVHAAEYVFFQSQFCKLSADTFLGVRRDGWEILYNSVDTEAFVPAAEPPPPRPLTLLLGGNQYQWYRVESALRTLAALRRERPDARLLVAGTLSFGRDHAAAERRFGALARELGVDDAVELAGTYTQREAPALLTRAHVLLHTKVNDPCPSIVIEAMACGVPVAYSASGGVPELVGEDGGVGVPTPLDWERDVPPPPGELAAAVLAVTERLDDYRAGARRRAVERFDLRPWLERHRRVFEALVA